MRALTVVPSTKAKTEVFINVWLTQRDVQCSWAPPSDQNPQKIMKMKGAGKTLGKRKGKETWGYLWAVDGFFFWWEQQMR